MIVILKQNPDPQKVQRLLQNLEGMGLSHHYSQGTENTIVGIIGDTSKAVSYTHLEAGEDQVV